MRLNTKVIRNLAFVIMLTAVPLTLKGGAPFVNCGPEWCPGVCALSSPPGGYMLWQGCDSGSCDGTGCAIGGEDCTRLCIACYGATEYQCEPIEGGLRK